MPPVAPRINNFMDKAALGTTLAFRLTSRAALRNRRQSSNLLKNAQTIHLGPRLSNFSIFNPVNSDTLVGNWASGGSDAGKRSAMGSLPYPADRRARTFHHH